MWAASAGGVAAGATLRLPHAAAAVHTLDRGGAVPWAVHVGCIGAATMYRSARLDATTAMVQCCRPWIALAPPP
ncbi:hypothetical protein COO60DRAFT_1511019, partial [Scenedesmus sp. NREL 46B-D3]